MVILKFHCYINQIFLKDVVIDDILISSEISSVEKNYKNVIGYMNDNYKIKLFNIIPPKMSTYIKTKDGETKWMYFLNEDDD